MKLAPANATASHSRRLAPVCSPHTPSTQTATARAPAARLRLAHARGAAFRASAASANRTAMMAPRKIEIGGTAQEATLVTLEATEPGRVDGVDHSRSR